MAVELKANTCAHEIQVEQEGKEGKKKQDLLTYLSLYFRAFGKRVSFDVSSEIPMSQGMKSSSAVSVSALSAALSFLDDPFGPPVIPPQDLIPLQLESWQLELLPKSRYPPLLSALITKGVGLSATGAMDDATASYHGGISFTDNAHFSLMEIRDAPDDTSVIAFMMPYGRGEVTSLKAYAQEFRRAFSQALGGDIYSAINVNGSAVAAAMGYSQKLLKIALKSGALAAGVTGNGPAIFAITREGDEGPVIERLQRFSLGIILTRPAQVDGKH